MNYDKWKSQVDITASLIEVLYGVSPEDFDKADDVDHKIREVLTVVAPEAVPPVAANCSQG